MPFSWDCESLPLTDVEICLISKARNAGELMDVEAVTPPVADVDVPGVLDAAGVLDVAGELGAGIFAGWLLLLLEPPHPAAATAATTTTNVTWRLPSLLIHPPMVGVSREKSRPGSAASAHSTAPCSAPEHRAAVGSRPSANSTPCRNDGQSWRTTQVNT